VLKWLNSSPPVSLPEFAAASIFPADLRHDVAPQCPKQGVGSLPDIANGQAQAIGNWLANLSQLAVWLSHDALSKACASYASDSFLTTHTGHYVR
jgi:hypothetical protein